jgi:DNA-directed RNA polymerase subunit RPC12/RpoP
MVAGGAFFLEEAMTKFHKWADIKANGRTPERMAELEREGAASATAEYACADCGGDAHIFVDSGKRWLVCTPGCGWQRLTEPGDGPR